MRKLVGWIGCTPLIWLTVALSVAPVAHADDDSFVAAARGLGMQQSPQYVIGSGHSVCNMLTLGQTPDQLADRIMGHSGMGADQAHQFITLSAHEYCPQFSDRVGG